MTEPSAIAVAEASLDFFAKSHAKEKGLDLASSYDDMLKTDPTARELYAEMVKAGRDPAERERYAIAKSKKEPEPRRGPRAALDSIFKALGPEGTTKLLAERPDLYATYVGAKEA